MAESSAGDLTVGKIQKTRRQRVAKMYGQQKRNIIHTSSTAYEQDHSAAAHNRRGAQTRPQELHLVTSGTETSSSPSARTETARSGESPIAAAHRTRLVLLLGLWRSLRGLPREPGAPQAPHFHQSRWPPRRRA